VPERSAAGREAGSRGEGPVNVIEGHPDGVRKRFSQSEIGRQRRREGGAGAVKAAFAEPGVAVGHPGPAVEEAVDDLPPFRLPPFDQDGLGSELLDGAGRTLRVGFALDGEPGQNGRFDEVRGDDGRGREEIPDSGPTTTRAWK